MVFPVEYRKVLLGDYWHRALQMGLSDRMTNRVYLSCQFSICASLVTLSKPRLKINLTFSNSNLLKFNKTDQNSPYGNVLIGYEFQSNAFQIQILALLTPTASL